MLFHYFLFFISLRKCTPVREDLRHLMASLDHSAQYAKEDTIRLQKVTNYLYIGREVSLAKVLLFY